MGSRHHYPTTRFSNYPIQPLLKWAGGKRQLLPHLRRFYPPAFRNYIEPFFGSGAVFFDLHGLGRLRDRQAVLIDSNPDLIGCYETVRDAPDEVARELEQLAEAHAAQGQRHYYVIRDDHFNPRREGLRQLDGRISYTPELAAMFIYLNRTGFNGLFRVNSHGAFNVPAGRYARPRICSREQVLRVADALSGARVRLEWGSFARAGAMAAPNDFLYFDPPYAPTSATARFTAYTAAGFDHRDQIQLQQLVIELANRDCHVVLSNSTADEIAALYDRSPEASAAGLRAHRVPARRAINSRPSGRGPIFEYLITSRRVAENPAI
jgi:DNA adenine methylase